MRQFPRAIGPPVLILVGAGSDAVGADRLDSAVLAEIAFAGARADR